MKIAIDVRHLTKHDNRGGIYRYTLDLINGLQELDQVNEYLLFFHCFRRVHREAIDKYSFGKNFHKVICRLPNKFLGSWLEKGYLPADIFTGRVNIFHGPAFTLLKQRYGKKVVTIHDLMFMHHPEFLKEDWVEPLRKSTSRAIKEADAIIAVSNSVKNEILEFFRVPAEKVHVIYNGIGKEFIPHHDLSRRDYIKSKYGIKSRYILFVGNIEPKKNLLRLIEAYSRFIKMSSEEFQLVIAGPKAWFYDRVKQHASSLGLMENVIFTGFVPGEDLPLLYSFADIFTFPSLNEGFGIPLIEAMACGTPVVASKIDSLTEVAGDAALMIDPCDVEEIADSLYIMMTDSEKRTKYVTNGFMRAKRFSWGKTAEETLRLYRELN